LKADFALLTTSISMEACVMNQYGDFDPAFDPRLALIYNPCKESTFKPFMEPPSVRRILRS